MRIFITSIMLIFSIASFAESQKILEVKSDQDSDVTTLSVVTQGGRISSMHMKTISMGAVKSDQIFSLAQVRVGIVLYTSGDHEVVRLKLSDRFEPQYGGPVTIDHLFNGITGSRKNMALEVSLQGAKWVLEHKGKNALNANVITNRVFGKVIGVKQIRF